MAKNFTARQAAKKADREAQRLEKFFAAQAPTVRVNLYDSRRAGNCVEGSLRYVESRLHIAREDILSAPWLMGVSGSRLLGDNNPRVQSAVRYAWMRETMVSI